jgi:hypothetical protein
MYQYLPLSGITVRSLQSIYNNTLFANAHPTNNRSYFIFAQRRQVTSFDIRKLISIEAIRTDTAVDYFLVVQVVEDITLLTWMHGEIHEDTIVCVQVVFLAEFQRLSYSPVGDGRSTELIIDHQTYYGQNNQNDEYSNNL